MYQKIIDTNSLITRIESFGLHLSQLKFSETKVYIKSIKKLISSIPIPNKLIEEVYIFYNKIDKSQHYTLFYNNLLDIANKYPILKIVLKLPNYDCKEDNKLHPQTILSLIRDYKFYYQLINTSIFMNIHIVKI